MVKYIIKGLVSFIAIYYIGTNISLCIQHNIDGTLVATGFSLIGYFLGLMFDVPFLKSSK